MFSLFNRKSLRHKLEAAQDKIDADDLLIDDLFKIRTRLKLENDSLKNKVNEQKLKLALQALVIGSTQVLVGGQGRGKTHFIERVILPQLRSYFLVDMSGGYEEVPPKIKISFQGPLDFYGPGRDAVLKSFMEPIMDAILDKRVIVVEDTDLLPDECIEWLKQRMKKGAHMVLVTQSLQRCVDLYKNYFDYLYYFGSNETVIQLPNNQTGKEYFLHSGPYAEKIIHLTHYRS
jgi:hypothetical protein